MLTLIHIHKHTLTHILMYTHTHTHTGSQSVQLTPAEQAVFPDSVGSHGFPRPLPAV